MKFEKAPSLKRTSTDQSTYVPIGVGTLSCSQPVLKRLANFALLLLSFAIMAPGISEMAEEVTEYTIYQGDPGFAPSPFPPWDNTLDGVTPAGFSYDIIKAVCDANEAMSCTVEVRPYGECITNPEAPFGVGVGLALLDEDVVGCVTWARTNARVRRGLVFTSVISYASSGGTDSTLYSSVGDNSPKLIGTLNFTSGFAANAQCVEDELGFFYQTISVGDTSADAVAAAIANGDDIVLFDADPVDTTGLTAIATLTCAAKGYSIVTYPPANLEKTNRFHNDFNCGLRLIAASGKYDAICNSYDGGDRTQPPFCLSTSEFEEPSKNCRKKEIK